MPSANCGSRSARISRFSPMGVELLQVAGAELLGRQVACRPLFRREAEVADDTEIGVLVARDGLQLLVVRVPQLRVGLTEDRPAGADLRRAVDLLDEGLGHLDRGVRV